MLQLNVRIICPLFYVVNMFKRVLIHLSQFSQCSHYYAVCFFKCYQRYCVDISFWDQSQRNSASSQNALECNSRTIP